PSDHNSLATLPCGPLLFPRSRPGLVLEKTLRWICVQSLTRRSKVRAVSSYALLEFSFDLLQRLPKLFCSFFKVRLVNDSREYFLCVRVEEHNRGRRVVRIR